MIADFAGRVAATVKICYGIPFTQFLQDGKAWISKGNR
jgi:hypothetical protein